MSPLRGGKEASTGGFAHFGEMQGEGAVVFGLAGAAERDGVVADPFFGISRLVLSRGLIVAGCLIGQHGLIASMSIIVQELSLVL